MPKRKIITIDEKKCNGCGLCIPNCPEGAIQLIAGKAWLISDLFCDGLGACLGHCPQGAITIEEREAQNYDEKKVMVNIVTKGEEVIKAHLKHLKEHHQHEYLTQALDFLKVHHLDIPLQDEVSHEHGTGGCPGSKMMDFREKEALPGDAERAGHRESKLTTWPVQIMLVPPIAPYLNNRDLLIAADCVPFAYADFHQDLLKAKTLLVGCPKLDDIKVYQDKISQIINNNTLKSITYAHMEVPCCFGLVDIIKSAIAASGKKGPL